MRERSIARARTLDAPMTINDEMRLLVSILRRATGPEKLVLGGGALLEALWHHRRSTDIDFFVEQRDTVNVIRDLDPNRDEMQWVLEKLRQVGECHTEGPEAKGALMRGHVRNVPFTIYPSESLYERRNRRRTITGVKAKWATIAEVFAGKIGDRWVRDLAERGSGKDWAPPIRDVYDMAVARTRAPREIQTVLERIAEETRRTLSRALAEVTEHGFAQDTKNLVEAKYQVDPAGAANQIGRALASANVEEIENVYPREAPKRDQGRER